MDQVIRSLSEPGTWIGALFIAVLAIFVAPWIPRAIKTAVLWLPRRIGQFFKALWQHLKAMSMGKTDPIAAVSYVGRELALLVMYAFLCLTLLLLIATLQIIDPHWSARSHVWLVAFSALAMLFFVVRFASIIILLMAFCEMIINPVKDPSIRIGPKEKPYFQLGPFKAVEPEPNPPDKPQSATDEKKPEDTQPGDGTA